MKLTVFCAGADDYEEGRAHFIPLDAKKLTRKLKCELKGVQEWLDHGPEQYKPLHGLYDEGHQSRWSVVLDAIVSQCFWNNAGRQTLS